MSELELWNELGNLHFKTGAYDEAIRMYQKAIALNQGCGQSYSNLATIFYRQGHFAEAIPMLQKGIETLDDARKQAALWNQLGEVYRKLEDFQSAVVACRKAAELDPDNTAYQDNLAEAELVARRVDPHNIPASDEETETIPELLCSLLDTIDKSEPECASWVFNEMKLEAEPAAEADPSPVILGSRILSTSASEISTPQKTEPAEQARESNPLRVQGLLRLGVLHLRKGEHDRALGFLNMALETVVRPADNYEEALCHYVLAVVETNMGQIQEAIQAYQSAASLAPDRIFPWSSVGNLNCILGHYDDAVAAYREALEHDSKDTTSWNALGDVYHKIGRFEDAIAAYQLGNVFEREKVDEDAIKSYEMALETDREDPQVWNEAGNIYFEAGAYDDAIASYRQAIELDPAHSFGIQANLTKAQKVMEEIRSKEASQAAKVEIRSDSAQLVDGYTPRRAVIAAEESLDQKNISQVLSTLYDGSTHPEPEPSYWVFKKEAPMEAELQPAERFNNAIVDRPVIPTAPAEQYPARPMQDRAVPQDTPALDASQYPSSEFVQLPPRAGQPVAAEDEIRASLVNSSWQRDYPEEETDMRNACVGILEPASDQAEPEVDPSPVQIIDQPAVDSQVLEKDIAAYRSVTENNPCNDRAWDALGNMYEAMGLHSEAIAAFEQAIALQPRKEAYHFHLGIALAYQLHYDKAITALLKVVAINPDYTLAHCALAAYYRRVGKSEEAQEHIIIARPSMEFENEYNKACFESISGNIDKAMEYLEIALEKGQAQPSMLRSDPDLDFIRSDPRFDALLRSGVCA